MRCELVFSFLRGWSMHIRARINARKIVLLYFYERYFLSEAAAHEQLFDDMDKIAKSLDDDQAISSKEVQQRMESGYYSDLDEEIAYIVTQHFAQFPADEIDYEYIRLMAPKFDVYKQEVQEKVDSVAVSFGYKDMDLIDRVVFVL